MKRQGREVRIKVKDVTIEGTSPGDHTQLTVSSDLFVGGVPNYTTIHPQAGFKTGFIGCVHAVRVGFLT